LSLIAEFDIHMIQLT